MPISACNRPDRLDQVGRVLPAPSLFAPYANPTHPSR